ncbi:hypothetical protein B0T18DRAFT_346158, partial [Schizothecium vesticola]
MGLAILVVYYNTTQRPETGFEKFMNTQEFGVRVLFTVFGVILGSFGIATILVSTTTLNPYHRLWSAPQPACTAVTVSPPTTAFTSLWPALQRREVFVSLVALSTLVSKFLPVLLSNIPFSPIQTWQLHLLCAWITVGCLVAMSLLLAFGLVWVRYPRMPIDPGTIAGRVYYLCHSREYGVAHGTE